MQMAFKIIALEEQDQDYQYNIAELKEFLRTKDEQQGLYFSITGFFDMQFQFFQFPYIDI